MAVVAPLRLTVWIAVWNAAPFVTQCLQSLLAQDYVYWDCVLVDDASEDATFAMVQALVGDDVRFVLVHNATRLKKMGSFVAAFPRFTGDIVVELDGDDWLERPDALAQIAACYADPLVDATSGRAINTNGDIIDNGYAFIPRSIDTPMIAPRTWRRSMMARAFVEIPDAFLDSRTNELWASSADMAIFSLASNYARKIAGTRDPVYRINMGNPHSDWVCDNKKQVDCSNVIYDFWRNRWFNRPYGEEP